VLVGMLREAERDARCILVTRMKPFVLLVLVVGLTASCDAFSEPERAYAYQYAVRGKVRT
jgi:hypothetical protein